MVNAWPVWLLTLATFAIYTLFALERHRQFNTAGYDLGIFDQAVRRYAHFQAPIVPLKGPSADHVAGGTGHLLCVRLELGLPNSR